METSVATAWKRLALGIVVQALRDVQDPGLAPYTREVAARFLDSAACREWLEAWTNQQYVPPGWWHKGKKERP